MGELLTTAELIDAGHTHYSIARAVRTGDLFRLVRGVYKRTPPYRDDYLAAIALAHPQLVYTGRTACEIYLNYTDKSRPYTVRATGSPTLGGLLESTHGRAAESQEVDGLRVVTPLAAAIDAHHSHPHLALDLLEKHYAGPQGKERLSTDLSSHTRVPKSFRDLLKHAAIGGDSQVERRLFRALRRKGLDVEQNFVLGPYRFDGLIQPGRIIIEIDSYEYHAVTGGKLERAQAKKVFTLDRWKQNLAARHGYVVLRYTAACIDDHFDDVVQQILAAVGGDEITAREQTGVWKWHEVYTGARFARRYPEQSGPRPYDANALADDEANYKWWI